MFLIFMVFVSYSPLILILVFFFYLLFGVIYLSFIMNSYFYSYLLFLLFISGLMVMFMYLCSVILNEKFTVGGAGLLFGVFLFLGFMNLKFFINFFDLGFSLGVFEFYNLLKFFVYSYNFFSLFFILYLLFCLLVVYEIIKKVGGPLRFNI